MPLSRHPLRRSRDFAAIWWPSEPRGFHWPPKLASYALTFAAAQSGLRPEDHRLSSPAALLQTQSWSAFRAPDRRPEQ
jgi:hypothetical protein